MAERLTTGELPDLLTPAQLAELLGGLSTGTLRNWRWKGRGPSYVKVAGRIRYRRSSVSEWLARQEIDPADRRGDR